ncbi:MAG: transposase [Chlamydiales bacterium]|nr:transposase [Chlamydiales bacterium]
MSGRFEGLSDFQWSIFSPFIPDLEYKFGRPRPNRRSILNTIIYVLITGCRWCDVPIGKQWAKRSTAHKYLKIWSQDKTFDNLRRAMLERLCLFLIECIVE